MNNNNKCYVFDMNGILKKTFDYDKFISLIESDTNINNFKQIYSKNLKAVETGKMNEDDFFNELIKDLNLKYNLDDFKILFKRCFNVTYDSTLEIIKALKEKGYKIYMFSSLKPIDYECFKNIYDMSLFDKLYLSYEVGYDKSDIDSFKFLINDLNTDPSNIYFFDDDINNINNAKSVGINAYQTNGEIILDTFNNNNLF